MDDKQTNKPSGGSIGKKSQASGNHTGGGAISELPMYYYGSKNPSNSYVKTTEAIGNYCGREYGKAIKTLIMKGTDAPPSAPKAPSATLDPAEATSVAEWRMYDKALDHYFKTLTQYNENKAKTFIIIAGQMSTEMQHKVEGDTSYSDLEKDDNVAGLLALIKSHAFTTTNAQYPFFTAATQFFKLAQYRQHSHEHITDFYKRWVVQVEIYETVYGSIHPDALITPTLDANKCTGRVKACLFLLALDRVQHGHVVDELNNQYLTGATEVYPTSPEGVVSLITYRSETGNSSRQRGSNKSNDQQSTDEPPKFYNRQKQLKEETKEQHHQQEKNVWFQKPDNDGKKEYPNIHSYGKDYSTDKKPEYGSRSISVWDSY
jgi:hypothetical protein